jgi:hypothetical protein
MASIPEGHARLAMGGWDRWTTGERGEIPGEDGVRAARGRGREFSASTKPTPVCLGFRPKMHTGVGLVGPGGNLDLAGNPPLNLDIKTSLIWPSICPDLKTSQIRPGTHSGGLRRSKSQ